jgi:hypothetical protein
MRRALGSLDVPGMGTRPLTTAENLETPPVSTSAGHRTSICGPLCTRYAFDKQGIHQAVLWESSFKKGRKLGKPDGFSSNCGILLRNFLVQFMFLSHRRASGGERPWPFGDAGNAYTSASSI